MPRRCPRVFTFFASNSLRRGRLSDFVLVLRLFAISSTRRPPARFNSAKTVAVSRLLPRPCLGHFPLPPPPCRVTRACGGEALRPDSACATASATARVRIFVSSVAKDAMCAFNSFSIDVGMRRVLARSRTRGLRSTVGSAAARMTLQKHRRGGAEFPVSAFSAWCDEREGDEEESGDHHPAKPAGCQRL